MDPAGLTEIISSYHWFQHFPSLACTSAHVEWRVVERAMGGRLVMGLLRGVAYNLLSAASAFDSEMSALKFLLRLTGTWLWHSDQWDSDARSSTAKHGRHFGVTQPESRSRLGLLDTPLASQCSDAEKIRLFVSFARLPVPESWYQERPKRTHDHESSLGACTLGHEGATCNVEIIQEVQTNTFECGRILVE